MNIGKQRLKRNDGMKKTRFLFSTLILLIGILMIGKTGQAQTIKVSARIDSTNNILIGDQVKLKLEASFPKGTLMLWPVVKDTIIKQIEVAGRSKIDTAYSQDNKNLILSQTFNITSFDSGTYKIPAFEFNYRFAKDTNNYIAFTNELYLNVNTIPVDTTKAIKDIKAPLKAPVTFKELVPYLAGGVLLAGIILLIVYYIRKKRKAEPLIKFRQVRVIPPHEAALLALQKLKDDKLWQNNKVKLYYVELTEILRKYMESRFQVDALEMTTDEITTSFKTIEIEEEQKRKLRNILVLADLVKFAKAQPLPNEHDICLDNAFDFVNRTIPVTVEEETISVVEDQTNEKEA
jgi:hypothetical protein